MSPVESSPPNGIGAERRSDKKGVAIKESGEGECEGENLRGKNCDTLFYEVF